MNAFDGETGDTIDDLMDNASGLSTSAINMLQNIQGNMPLFNSMLNQTNNQFDSGVDGLKELKG